MKKTTILLLMSIMAFLYCSETDSNPLVGSEGDVTPPGVPTGLSLPNVGNGEITITWNVNPEADLAGYKLFRSADTDDLSNYILINNSTDTSFKDAILDYDTKYYYRLKAYDHTGNESDYSLAVAGQPFNTHAPSIPSDLDVVAQNLGSSFFDITWDANTEADFKGYKLYKSTNFNFPADASTLVDSTYETFYLDTEIELDSVYYYKVTAYDIGDWESLATVPVSDVALSPPDLLSPVDNEEVSATPTFTWEAVANAVQYKLFLQTSSQGGEIWVTIIDGSQNSIEYAGTQALGSGETYYWKVATITKDANRLNSISNIFRIRIN